jgi:hypothetical protein
MMKSPNGITTSGWPKCHFGAACGIIQAFHIFAAHPGPIMSPPENIDALLRDWPFDPRTLSVRIVQADDGRDVLQMRIDMGLLQLEIKGRPDGERPQGFETYDDYLRHEAKRFGAEFVMDDDQCDEVDREFVQFYQRRISWLRLQNYENAIRDADHTIALMDFCKKYSPDEQWTLSHEQYRPFVLFHRTQAAALSALDDGGAELAIQAITSGLDQLRSVFEEYEADEHFEEDELVLRLLDLRETLRKEYDVGKTLPERLAEAVDSEEYELAAKLRDELAKRKA